MISLPFFHRLEALAPTAAPTVQPHGSHPRWGVVVDGRRSLSPGLGGCSGKGKQIIPCSIMERILDVHPRGGNCGQSILTIQWKGQAFASGALLSDTTFDALTCRSRVLRCLQKLLRIPSECPDMIGIALNGLEDCLSFDALVLSDYGWSRQSEEFIGFLGCGKSLAASSVAPLVAPSLSGIAKERR